MERLVCLLIGYIFGLFQTGYFYGKTQGVDIRKMGSGNAGSTNALRTMGIKAGMIAQGLHEIKNSNCGCTAPNPIF